MSMFLSLSRRLRKRNKPTRNSRSLPRTSILRLLRDKKKDKRKIPSSGSQEQAPAEPAELLNRAAYFLWKGGSTPFHSLFCSCVENTAITLYPAYHPRDNFHVAGRQ